MSPSLPLPGAFSPRIPASGGGRTTNPRRPRGARESTVSDRARMRTGDRRCGGKLGAEVTAARAFPPQGCLSGLWPGRRGP